MLSAYCLGLLTECCTILDLSYACFEVVQAQVTDLIAKTVEIHIGDSGMCEWSVVQSRASQSILCCMELDPLGIGASAAMGHDFWHHECNEQIIARQEIDRLSTRSISIASSFWCSSLVFVQYRSAGSQSATDLYHL